MANSTITFQSINTGDNGSEVNAKILSNLSLLSQRIIDLETELSNIKKSTYDGGTVIQNTGSIVTQLSPSVLVVKKSPTSQTLYVYVNVYFGETELAYGTDNSSTSFSASVVDTTIDMGGTTSTTVEAQNNFGKLRISLSIPNDVVNDGKFSFTVTFKGKVYTYTIPVILVNSESSSGTGQGIFVSTIFKRQSADGTVPTTPTGGTFSSPLPETITGSGEKNQGWSDGIPSGITALYSSHRTFTSDNNPPHENEWSMPILALDNPNMDICFTSYSEGTPGAPQNHGTQSETDPYGWHDVGVEGDIWMAVSVKNNGTWGDWSISKIKGENGTNGDWTNYIFKESSGSTLSKPTLAIPSNFVDRDNDHIFNEDGSPNTEVCNQGWKDGPGTNGIWWMCCGVINGETGKLNTNTSSSGWTTPIKITPEGGVAGQACFMSTVFARWAADDIASITPHGGSYTNPKPDNVNWYDSIPADNGIGLPLWESHMRFTSDGESPQDEDWSAPKLMLDSADFDCCYSSYTEGVPPSPTTHGTQEDEYWHNAGTSDDVWMATSYKKLSGDWSTWVITKIKGENGNDGDWMDYIFKSSSASTVATPTLDDPNLFPTITDKDSENYGWVDGPGSGSTWWMSCALIDGNTGKVDAATGQGWSTPTKLNGTAGADGSYVRTWYKATQEALSHPAENAVWHDTTTEAYNEIGGASYLPSGYYLWLKQQKYDGPTKTWGTIQYMRVTGEKGETGTSLNVKDSKDSYYDLFSTTTPQDGDAYLVNGDMWVYSASSDYVTYDSLSDELKEKYNPGGAIENFPDPGHWLNCGHVVGPQGESSYIHIKYAIILDKTIGDKKYPSAMTNTPSKYIGTKVDSNKEADEIASGYTWSQFTGNDGFGYEYIYQTNTTGIAPNVPTSGECQNPDPQGHSFSDDDYVPTNWTDNPAGVSASLPYEYMAKRQKVDGKWQYFTGQANNTSKALLYSYYGSDGQYSITRFGCFASYTYDETTMKDDSKWSPEGVMPTATTDAPYVWMKTCRVTPKRGSQTEDVYTDWVYARVTGEKGDTGTGLNSKGTCTSYDQLFKLANTDYVSTLPNDGDSYLLFGDLWYWSASADSLDADYSKYETMEPQRKWRNGGHIQGPTGTSGATSHLHIKYANKATYVSGKTYTVDDVTWLTTYSTTNDGEAPGKFIGQFVDYNDYDPSGTDPRYKWTKWSGDDGVGYEYIYCRTSGNTAVNVPTISEGMYEGTDVTRYSVVSGYTAAGVIIPGTKAYQEEDWVPYTGTRNRFGQKITNQDWSDNPMGPTLDLPYEWCCKRLKTTRTNGTSLWGIFEGQAKNTALAYLYNKFAQSAINIDMTNPIHNYSISGNTCAVETISCKITVTSDGAIQKISNLTISGDTSQFSTYRPNYNPSVAQDAEVVLTNRNTMSSGGTLDFHITVGNTNFIKTYAYSVTKHGENGEDAISIYCNPDVIVGNQDIDTLTIDTTNAYTDIVVSKYGEDLTAETDYTVTIASGSSSHLDCIDYSFGINRSQIEKGRYRLQITRFDKRSNLNSTGSAMFNVVIGSGTSATTFNRAVQWNVNYQGTVRQRVSADTLSTISSGITAQLFETGIDVSGQTVTITGDNVKVRDNSGNIQAFFNNGGIATNWLSANTITAVNARTENLTLNNAKAVDESGNTTINIDGTTGAVEMTGRITATSGKIGNFVINSGGLNFDGLSGTSDFPYIGLSYSGKTGNLKSVSIGKSMTSDDFAPIMTISHQTTKDITAGGCTLFLSASGAATNNFSLLGVGDVCINGSLSAYKYDTLTITDDSYFWPTDKTVTLLTISHNRTFFITYTNTTAKYLALPILSDAYNSLGKSASSFGNTPFAFEITLIITEASTGTGSFYLAGQDSSIDIQNLPKFYNPTGTQIKAVALTKGNTIKIMLTYDGSSSYKAYITSRCS